MAIRTNEGNRVKFIPTDYGEIAQDITGMTDAEELAYHRFMVFYMSRGYLPVDDLKLKRIARLSEPFSATDISQAVETFKSLELVFKAEAVEPESGEVQETIRHEEWDNMLTEARNKVDENIAKGKRITQARLDKRGASDEN